MAGEEQGLVIRLGPLSVDIPRSFGYFGAVGLAVGAGLVEPPLGMFIAAVPVMKMLSNSRLPRPARFVGQLLDGAAKPVGGDAEGTIRLADPAAGPEEEPPTPPRSDGRRKAAPVTR